MADVKSPGVAAVLSALIPGLGQIYNGDFLRAIFWLIVTPGMWMQRRQLDGLPRDRPATAYIRARKKNLEGFARTARNRSVRQPPPGDRLPDSTRLGPCVCRCEAGRSSSLLAVVGLRSFRGPHAAGRPGIGRTSTDVLAP